MWRNKAQIKAMGGCAGPTSLLVLLSKGVMTMDLHWEWILLHETEIRAMLARMCRKRYDLLDELWSEVIIEKCEQCMNAFDPCHPSHASLKTYMMRNLQMYTWKWMNRLGRPHRERGFQSLSLFFDKRDSPHGKVVIEKQKHDDVDEVKTILDQLDEYDRTLLELRHIHDLTFQEIADVIGVSAKTTARIHYRAALARAQSFITPVQ